MKWNNRRFKWKKQNLQIASSWFDALLAGGQTRLKLQLMYGILAQLEPL